MVIYAKGKIWKTGNGYVVTIPKAIIEAGNFALGDDLLITLAPAKEQSRQTALEVQQATYAQSGVLPRNPARFAFVGRLCASSSPSAP